MQMLLTAAVNLLVLPFVHMQTQWHCSLQGSFLPVNPHIVHTVVSTSNSRQIYSIHYRGNLN